MFGIINYGDDMAHVSDGLYWPVGVFDSGAVMVLPAVHWSDDSSSADDRRKHAQVAG